MLRIVLLALLLSAVPVFAAKHAPLPAEIYSAKTVYIINNTGMQQVMDVAYDQITKWGRYSVTTEKSKADIVVIFNHRSGLSEGTTIGFTEMIVSLPGADQPAYQATERYKMKLFGNSSIKSCIEDFKKRVDKN